MGCGGDVFGCGGPILACFWFVEGLWRGVRWAVEGLFWLYGFAAGNGVRLRHVRQHRQAEPPAPGWAAFLPILFQNHEKNWKNPVG